MANPSGKVNIIQRISKFVTESWIELQKCSWPSKQELTKSTIMVFVSLIVVTIWIGGLDFVLGTITKPLIQK
ncbi:MAG: preprotein translocase subunit SecE [Armatimonadota bacterium]